jgi:hypothetical protein
MVPTIVNQAVQWLEKNDYDVSVRVPIFVSLPQHFFGLLGEILM